MTHQNAPFIVMIVALIIIAIVIINLFHYRLKRRLLDSGPVDENTIRFLRFQPGPTSEALKWGLILFFGGLGLVVLDLIPYRPDESSLPYGVEAICISAALLIYYFIIKRSQP